jgi:hypothetical protein
MMFLSTALLIQILLQELEITAQPKTSLVQLTLNAKLGKNVMLWALEVAKTLPVLLLATKLMILKESHAPQKFVFLMRIKLGTVPHATT